MTRPISQVAPGNNGDNSEREPFTDKKSLKGVPLTITGAKHVPRGPHGPFHIITATRQDTGEKVVFTGATVLDQQMASCISDNAFPVVAMLDQQGGEDNKSPYWIFTDPPDFAPKDRTAEVLPLMQAAGLEVADIQALIEEIAGAKVLVRDLNDDQYADLLHQLTARADEAVPF